MNPSVEEIWTQYATRLRFFIRGRVGNDAVAEDLLQDVFLKIHQRLTQLREPEKLESWIFQITRRAIADYFRQAKDTTPLPEELETDPTPSPADEDLRHALMASFQRMIDTLPKPYGEAIRLTEVEGLTQQELADRLGLSLSGAKSRVQRGRAMLKDRLLACCRFEFDRRGGIVECQPRKKEDCGECD